MWFIEIGSALSQHINNLELLSFLILQKNFFNFFRAFAHFLMLFFVFFFSFCQIIALCMTISMNINTTDNSAPMSKTNRAGFTSCNPTVENPCAPLPHRVLFGNHWRFYLPINPFSRCHRIQCVQFSKKKMCERTQLSELPSPD